jgi:LuxR family maltose regulon positive regulatory protein
VAFGNRASLPRIAERLLHRPELDRRLGQWAPLTIVRGLRGYGKTTAVAAFLERQSTKDVTAVWVDASPVGAGEASLEDCLSGALRAAGTAQEPVRGQPAPSAFDDLRSALSAESPDRKFVLVIDNFEKVRDERVLAELVRLVELHRHLHIIVCCQGHHPIESMVAGMIDVNAIEPGELLLGVDDIVELSRAMGSPLDHNAAEDLHSAVGGGISMLQMVLAGAEHAGNSTVRPAVIEDYVRIQLLGDIANESLMEHLMRFSCTELATWPAFRDLCGEADPRRLLDDMEATGLVARVNDAEGLSFSMPAPIREILHDQYVSSAPDKARQFHGELAQWFAAHSAHRYTSLAFHHAVAGGSWELMDRLWSDGILTMVREDLALLTRSLHAIPTEVVTSRPSMLVLRDISHIATADTDADGHRATLRAFADGCTRLVNKQWETIELNELLILATGYLIELRLLGRLQESVVFGDRVYARARTLSAKQPINKGRFSWFHVHRGTTLMLLGDDAGAIVSYRRAWEYATGAGADFIQAQAAANLALTYALGGDSAKAIEWLGRHRSLDTSDWPGTYACGIGAHVAAGLLALDRLDEDTARSEVEYLRGGSAALELWSFIAYLRAQYALYYGDAAEALAQLEQVQARSEEGDRANKGATGALLSRARADLLIACGRGEKTRQLIRSQGPRQPWSRVPAARIRLLGGPGSGIELDSVTWDPATSTRDRLEMLLLRAVESLRNGDSRNAARLAGQALDLSGEVGILRPFAAITAEERAQLLELTGREMEPGDVEILARRPPVYPARLVFVELSQHEHSVLEALSHDGSRQAIAASLFVSVNTIKSQLASIFRKLGTATRADTLAKARELELLPPAIPG